MPFVGELVGNLSYEEGFQNYKYNGKEMDRMYGLDWLDYGARMYNPAIGLWTQMDPLAEKYYHLNPYLYCAGNPIRFIDSNGLEPTPAEAARIAKDVYNKVSQLSGPWRRVSFADLDVNLSRENTGFQSAIYGKWDEKNKCYSEYVYATAGTNPLSAKDWQNNFSQLFGKSEQYSQSVENAQLIHDYLKGKELTYVGHSLGGGLASANSLRTGDNAITFNAAGLSEKTKQNLRLNNNKGNITAYVVNGEIVNATQSLLGLKAEGNIINIKPKVDFPNFAPIPALVNSIAKHTMIYTNLFF